PPPVPVRHRTCARDPRRRARAPVSEPLLWRCDAPVLELAGRGLLTRRLAALERRELRQGRARPDGARLARRRAGALSRRRRGRGVTSDELLGLAERALALTEGEAQVTALAERSLFSRFARSRPTQA